MNGSLATFHFYGAAKTLLKSDSDNTNSKINYQFDRHPSVKDAIESLGPPHTDVVAIIVNSKPENFDYLLNDQDVVDVYSFDAAPDIPVTALLPNIPEGEPAFVLDVHLGGLARYLRFYGLDTLYDVADPGDNTLASISALNSRILLTRDIGLLKHAKIQYGHWLRNTNPKKQLVEVATRYQLKKYLKPFSRCSLCNGLISAVEKQQLAGKIKTSAYEQFDRFWLCESCGQVYWKGKHYYTIKKELAELERKLPYH